MYYLFEFFNTSKSRLLDMSEKQSCPYCDSVFDNKEELSKHIDRIHHGSGLLEGDTRKF